MQAKINIPGIDRFTQYAEQEMLKQHKYIMDIHTYLEYWRTILGTSSAEVPYNDPEYLHYASLNWFRQQRWLKIAELDEELVSLIKAIKSQQWIFITEPWCGDAAHILPFIIRLLNFNFNISLKIERRDAPPFTIDDYLTGTSKSIPILIIREYPESDLAVWGPRPASCQELYHRLQLKDTETGQLHIAIQNWYNEDQGRTFQKELLQLLTRLP